MANFNIHEASSSTSSSSSSCMHYKYDVFLSFRGEDTRNNFVSHLYKALSQKGINTFKDDKKLEKGKSISPEIAKVIQESRFSVIVFSKNYANSTWCLEELEMIIECMHAKTQTVLPIFYAVDPSDVSEQTGSYAEAFAKHEQDLMIESGKIRTWRSALTKAANLAGWDSRYKDEANFIDEITRDVLNKLSRISSNSTLGLVGMDSRKKKMELLLAVGLNDVRMVGICGMGGVGKTTIAEFVYGHFSSRFDGFCFLKGVRKAVQRVGLDVLRQQLVSEVSREEIKPWEMDLDTIKKRFHSKCVLIVLDDVDDEDQLEALAAKHDWFGPGSRIIITSRDKQLLNAHRVDFVYEVEHLSSFESLQLFRQCAFKDGHVTDDFMALSKRLVNYANGLPLAVKVLGSFLCGKNLLEWEGESNNLRSSPPQKVQNVLRISFDGLDNKQKSIFLDIACFFNRDDVNNVTKFLESCGFSPATELRTLCDKSLISILENKISMHDLLQEMGREIVRKESEEPGNSSRLWDHKDAHHVLAENKGTEKVEGIILDLSKIQNANFNSEVFSRMTKLRLLKICYVHRTGSFEHTFQKELCINVHLFGNLIYLSNELRFLHWNGYPLKYLPSNFFPQNLIELNMSYGCIKMFWTETKCFDNLKLINLSNSKELVRTPNFTETPNLEVLNLEGCTKLSKVHPSVGWHKRLVLLNLKDCKSVRKFSGDIGMKSLKVFILSGCSKFELFPNIQENMECLLERHLDGIAIKRLPVSIEKLTGLLFLSARNCKSLKSLPPNIGCVTALKTLNLSGCSNLETLPENLGLLERLEELHLDETAVTQLPPSICHLRKLKILSFHGRKEFPSNLRAVLRQYLDLSTSSPLQFFAGLSCLTDLDLSNRNLGDDAIPNGYADLSSLKKLNLSGNYFSSLPESICLLPNLEVLLLACCKRLEILPALPSRIYCVDAANCTSMTLINYPLGVNEFCIRSFNFINCFKLHGITINPSLLGKEKTGQVITLLEEHIDKMPRTLFAEFSIIIPGRRMPEWYPHERVGSLAVTWLHEQWYDKTFNFKGLALWAVFEVDSLSSSNNDLAGQNYRLDFLLKCNDKNLISETGLVISRDTKFKSDHLWLRYVPSFSFKMAGNYEIKAFL